ncbi:DUF3800 domain-containing protein [Ornithobacterium rhinotracheale]|uniref:DUF3800 domain-containing protein n=1 Tax=Ornithobacterium rhinotracheale TaxID=28251 RepID=UPI00129C17A9|nr:DUF3800 domain-containing protein [Ornithobacterium rhinotracheale]MRI63398.1 DUF3800 domain-containing protein [Ornithobacterium rhinotracheale]
MHFFYIDETGCDGRSLKNPQEPIFVLGGIIIRDEGWNKTHSSFVQIISDYFDGNVPENFELHTQDLFSKCGSGFFEGYSRDKRNKLIHDILDLVHNRKHHYYYFAVDKSKLEAYDIGRIAGREYLELKTPYLIAYDYLITSYEKYTKETLGKTARAMIIIDEKEIFINEIQAITRYRRFDGPSKNRTKWIAEFSFAVDSKRNTMIQISDLLLYLTRKYLEIENGYKDTMHSDIKNIFRDFYRKIDSRLIFKSIQKEENGRNVKYYNDFIKEVSCLPNKGWNKKVY